MCKTLVANGIKSRDWEIIAIHVNICNLKLRDDWNKKTDCGMPRRIIFKISESDQKFKQDLRWCQPKNWTSGRLQIIYFTIPLLPGPPLKLLSCQFNHKSVKCMYPKEFPPKKTSKLSQNKCEKCTSKHFPSFLGTIWWPVWTLGDFRADNSRCIHLRYMTVGELLSTLSLAWVNCLYSTYSSKF